jgi:hypothetical protein
VHVWKVRGINFQEIATIDTKFRHKGTLIYKQSTLNYGSITTKFISYLAHAWNMRGMRFQENASMENEAQPKIN